MKYGQGSVSSDEMNQHKAMAGAGRKGDSFGVGGFPGNSKPHPDAGMKHDSLADAQRSTKPALGDGKMRRQASADHGPVYDHFNRDGNL